MTSRKMVLLVFGLALATVCAGTGIASDDKGLGACEGVRLKGLVGGRAQTINDVMASWVGSHLSETVARWGAPYSTFENRDGSRIITWKDGGCAKNFKVDLEDVLTHWSVGSGCRCFNGSSPSFERRNLPVPHMTL